MGIKSTDYTINDPFIYDVKDLIAVNVTFVGKTGGSSAISAGTVVGMITASKKYQAYNNSNSDGTETAVGILLEDVPALSAGKTYSASIAVRGSFIEGKLIGLDTGAKTDFGSRTIVLDTNKSILII